MCDCMTAEASGYRKKYLHTQDAVLSIPSRHSFQTVQKTISDQTAFAMTVSKAKRQTVKRAGKYRLPPAFYPRGQSVAFS